MTIRIQTSLAALASCLLGTASAGTNTWTINSPEGGAAGSVVYLPGIPGGALVSMTDVIYRTTDNGITWSKVHSKTNELQITMVVDPSNPNRVLSHSRAFGVLVSNDRGLTFSNLVPSPMTIPIAAKLVFAPKGQIAYGASTSGTIYRSPDSGASWTAVSTGLPTGISVTGLAVSPANANIVYAAFDRSTDSLFRTQDGGASWSSLNFSTGVIRSIAIDPNNTQSIVIGSFPGGLQRSINAGMTWTQVDAFRPPHVIRFDPSVPGRVFALTMGEQGGGFLRSLDSGQNWTLKKKMQSFTAYDLAVDSTQTGHVMYAGSEGVMITEDAGDTWVARNNNLTGGNFIPLSAHTQSKMVFAGADQSPSGMYARSPQGQWKQLNMDSLRSVSGNNVTSVVAFSVAPNDANIIYLGMNVGFFKSIDGGATWSKPSTQLDTSQLLALAVDPKNNLVAYGAVQLGGVYRTADGGVTWSPSSVGLTPSYICALVIDPKNSQIIYAASCRHSSMGVFKSIDGGANWSPANVGMENGNLISLVIDPSDSNKLYASASALYKSENAGATWQAKTDSMNVVFDVALNPESPNILTILPYKGQSNSSPSGVGRSVDGGTTWEYLPFSDSTYSPWRLTFDPINPRNLIGGASHYAMVEMEVAPDLELTLASSTTVNDRQTSTFAIRNRASYAATSIKFSVNLPAGSGSVAQMSTGSCTQTVPSMTCSVPSLRAGETVNVTVTFTPPAVTTSLSATVQAYENDPVATNNTATFVSPTPPETQTNPKTPTSSSGGGGGQIESWLFAFICALAIAHHKNLRNRKATARSFAITSKV